MPEGVYASLSRPSEGMAPNVSREAEDDGYPV
jgi:hypothetical protein